jgi:hypothetical protein
MEMDAVGLIMVEVLVHLVLVVLVDGARMMESFARRAHGPLARGLNGMSFATHGIIYVTLTYIRWGGSKCPASDWPGWTQGPWATNADWTTWTGCAATVTATSVFTTVPANGTAAITSTSFGYQVAQATNSLVSTSAQSGNPAPTNVIAGGAVVGALAGVIAML